MGDVKDQIDSDQINLQFQSREEYAKALETWVDQARVWHNITTFFPYFVMANYILHNNNTSFTTIAQVRAHEYNIRNEQQRSQTQPRQLPIDLTENEGYEFVIPPVWKRMLAEGVDFIILFILKLSLTLIALEVTDTSNWQFLKDDILSNIADIHLGTEITTRILILEGIHRIIVCAYEVYWLRGTDEARFGCASPGKALLGITVIVSTKIRPLEMRNNRQTVLVYPAKDLSFFIALGRSFIKNFILAVMFPFCFAFFLFQYNRTGYDIVCNTLVVEHNPNPPKRNWA